MPKKLDVFRADVMVCGTIYIKAKSEDEAREILQKQDGLCLAAEAGEGDVYFSGAQFDSPDLPDVSFSPVMTITLGPTKEILERVDD